MAQEPKAVMKEFLVSSEPCSMFISNGQSVKNMGKEFPGYCADSWQWLYRFPNGLGASVVRRHFKPQECETGVAEHGIAIEVTIVRFSGDKWKILRDTNRNVPEADLETYLGMIRDISLDDVKHLTETR